MPDGTESHGRQGNTMRNEDRQGGNEMRGETGKHTDMFDGILEKSTKVLIVITAVTLVIALIIAGLRLIADTAFPDDGWYVVMVRPCPDCAGNPGAVNGETGGCNRCMGTGKVEALVNRPGFVNWQKTGNAPISRERSIGWDGFAAWPRTGNASNGEGILTGREIEDFRGLAPCLIGPPDEDCNNE